MWVQKICVKWSRDYWDSLLGVKYHFRTCFNCRRALCLTRWIERVFYLFIRNFTYVIVNDNYILYKPRTDEEILKSDEDRDKKNIKNKRSNRSRSIWCATSHAVHESFSWWFRISRHWNGNTHTRMFLQYLIEFNCSLQLKGSVQDRGASFPSFWFCVF